MQDINESVPAAPASGHYPRKVNSRSVETVVLIALPLIMITLTLILYQLGQSREQAAVQEDMRVVRNMIATRVQRTLDARIGILNALGNQLLRFDSTQDIEVATDTLQAALPASMMLMVLDSSDKVIHLAGRDDSVADFQSSNPAKPLDRKCLERLKKKLQPVLGPPTLTSSGDCAVDLYIPVQHDKSGLAMGAVVNRLEFRELMNRITDRDSHMYVRLKLMSGGQLLYDNHPNEIDDADYAGEEAFQVNGLELHLIASPRSELFVLVHSQEPFWVLVGGLLATGLTTLAVAQAFRIQRRDLRQATAHAQAMEELHGIGTAISGKIGSDDDTLHSLAVAATQLLRMSKTCILVFEHPVPEYFSDKHELPRARVVACLGVDGMEVGDWFSPDQMPTSRIAVKMHRVLLIEDTATSTLPVATLQRFGVRAAIQMPLWVDNRVIGIMTMGDHSPRKFNSVDERLARVWGAQAAVTLANAQLHKQIRYQAEAKAMLLRELNHRVKNNLAGIVGLITSEAQNVPAEAIPSLNRLAGRVWVMARAHELFAGGAARVGLDELIRQVLASMGVARPAGLEIRIELQDVRARIKTDRAVSLAMALHELFFNAIIHGIQGRGVLEISAMRGLGGNLVICVADDGGTKDETFNTIDLNDSAVMTARKLAEHTRTGVGLQLVAGLVQRELNGKFFMEPRPTGGTRAVIEFPLVVEEWQEDES